MEENKLNSVDVNYIVVWLDKTIEETRNNQDTKARIRCAVRGELETFTDPDKCVEFIVNEIGKRVFLIISASFGHYIVPLIYQIPQIQTIYVFCVNRQRAEQWAKPHFKISGVFTDKKVLIEKLQDDILACNNDRHLPMSIFHLTDTENSLRDLTNDSATFMWYQLLLIVLQRLPRTKDSKEEMIAECRLIYHNDLTEQDKINYFHQEYIASKAIWWYTCDCFVYRLLNKALRTQNIDIIFKFRFFINDLHRRVKELYLEYLDAHKSNRNHSLIVYRGQHLSIEEINLIKSNVNGLISMNTFLSATLNINLALIYAETETKCTETSPIQSVLFIINISDINQETTPFAPIKSYSCYEEEDEVLFSLSAVFRVQSVEQLDDMWHIHLELGKEQNKLYQELSTHIMKQIGSESSPLTLGWFLYRMNEFNKAENYAYSLLKQLQKQDREAGNAYNLLGLIYKDIGRLPQAVESYGKALEIYSSTNSLDSPQIIATHYNLGLAFLASGNKQRASEQLQKAEGILINSSHSNNSLLKAMTDSLKAKLETSDGDYLNAFRNLEAVLITKKKKLPRGHPSIASTLKEMGIVQSKMNNDDKAIDYFKQALDIFRKGLTANHLDLADCYANIGRINYKHKKYSDALKNFQKALEITKDASREDIEGVENLERCIADTKKMMK